MKMMKTIPTGQFFIDLLFFAWLFAASMISFTSSKLSLAEKWSNVALVTLSLALRIWPTRCNPATANPPKNKIFISYYLDPWFKKKIVFSSFKLNEGRWKKKKVYFHFGNLPRAANGRGMRAAPAIIAIFSTCSNKY